MKNLWVVAVILSSLSVEAVPIPEPLSLKQALSFATEPHPDQQMALAQQRAAEARLGVAERGQAMTVDLSGRIRWKTLQQQPEQRLGDHLLSITARKPLYDFGRSELAEQIAQGEVTQQQWGVVDAPEQKKLEIMEHFFADSSSLLVMHFKILASGRTNFISQLPPVNPHLSPVSV